MTFYNLQVCNFYKLQVCNFLSTRSVLPSVSYWWGFASFMFLSQSAGLWCAQLSKAWILKKIFLVKAGIHLKAQTSFQIAKTSLSLTSLSIYLAVIVALTPTFSPDNLACGWRISHTHSPKCYVLFISRKQGCLLYNFSDMRLRSNGITLFFLTLFKCDQIGRFFALWATF